MFETADQNGWVVRALSELDPRPFANSLALEVYERLPNDTDFTPFADAGKQGLNFAAIGRGNVYHQSTDTPEHLSEGTLQHHGLRALAALRWFGAALRENPRYAPTHRALADLFRAKGDRARAEHHRQLAETGSPSLP